MKNEIRIHVKKRKSAGFFDQVDPKDDFEHDLDQLPSSNEVSNDLLQRYNQNCDDLLKVVPIMIKRELR